LFKYSAKIATSSTNSANEVLRDCWEIHYGKYKPDSEPIYIQTKEIMDEIKPKLETKRISNTPPWKKASIETDSDLVDEIYKNTSSEIQKATALEKIHEYADCLAIYTDAAKLPNGSTGCSYYVPVTKTKRKCHLHSTTSVTTAELIAIYDALKFAENKVHNFKKIAIFTDSLEATKQLEDLHKLLLGDIETEISNIVNNLKIVHETTATVIWIPGHVGIKGNQKADILAKEAAAEEHIDEMQICKFSWNDVKLFIDNRINSLWQDMYNKSRKGLHYKQLQPLVSRQIKYSSKSRKDEIIITRLRLGKCKLNKYLHELHAHPTGKCINCGTDETIQHYLMECPYANIFSNAQIPIQEALESEECHEIILRRTKELGKQL